MRFYSIFTIVFIFVGVNIKDCSTTTSRTIPDYLTNCYRNGGTQINAPHNVQLLVELISKIEKTNNNYNVRKLSSSLLHSLRLDGIERSPRIKETSHVIPYRASAFQFAKYSLLLDLLIPGENLANIRDGLHETELCTLHFLISSTVDPWERGDEERICPMSINKMGTNSPTETFYYIPFFQPQINRTIVPPSHSRCPIESGIIQTLWGDISPGTLIAGISAALEPQDVKVQDVVMQQKDFDDVNMVSHSQETNKLLSEPDIETFNTLFTKKLMASGNVISNVLAATLAGDIAELAIRQGPLNRSNSNEYNIGSQGKWNDTLIPRYYYLFLSEYGDWEMTDAEILAGIDGFIIANYIKEWSSILDRIRLSQIIEMYYSSYGVAMNHGIRACNRRQNMAKLLKASNIHEQTINLVNVLWLRLSTVFITPEGIQNISSTAVRAFENYWPRLLDKLPSCDVRGDTCPMDVILATDGTWTKYQTEQLVTILSETLDVSSHGSSLGLMHGNTGEWLASPSHSILQIFDRMANHTYDWPDRLNLPAVLTGVITHLEDKTDHERQSNKVAGLPHVIILAAPRTALSQADLENSVKIMASLRASYTDVYILYLTPDINGFKKLTIDPRKHSDMLIETSNTNVQEVAEMIRLNFITKTIPKRLISPLCTSSVKSTGIRLQYEDYINVGQKVLYRIHPSHLMYVPIVKVQFQGTDQGDISVCVSRKYTEDAAVSCKLVTGQYDASFQIKHPCNGEAFCDPIYFIVRARSTLIKCADYCRYPDQIRFIVRHEGMQCKRFINGTSGGITFQKKKIIGRLSLIFVSLIIYSLIYV